MDTIDRKVLKSSCVIKLLRESQLPVSQCWHQIGGDLGVPLEERRKFRQVMVLNCDYWIALEECIEWWMRNDAEPTWKNLLTVIEKCDKKSVGEIIDELSSVRGPLLCQPDTPFFRPPELYRTSSSCSSTSSSTSSSVTSSGIRKTPIRPPPSSSRCSKWFVIVALPIIALACNLILYPLGFVVWTTVAIAVTFLVCFCGYSLYYKGNSTDLPTTNDESSSKEPNDTINEPDSDSRIWIAGETGRDVVMKCIGKLKELEAAELFPNDKDFMERLAFVMSRNGEALFQLHNDGGIWQVGRFAFDDTKNEFEHIRLPKKYQRLSDFLGIKDWRKVTRVDLEIPMYSCLAARLYLSNFAESIPPSFNHNKQQEYWWRFYMHEHEAKRHMRERDFTDAVNVMRKTN